MSRNYKFRNPEGLYFVSFAVVEWLDVFSKDEYKDILVESLKYCQKEKGLEIIAWCIMSNHVHLVFKTINDFKPEQVLGDFKRFTSKKVVKAIIENPKENSKDYFLNTFKKSAKQTSNVRDYQFWRHDNQPIELWSNRVIAQKVRYVHQNPVKAGYVTKAEDYLYSSAINYTGEKGLIDDIIIAELNVWLFL